MPMTRPVSLAGPPRVCPYCTVAADALGIKRNVTSATPSRMTLAVRTLPLHVERLDFRGFSEFPPVSTGRPSAGPGEPLGRPRLPPVLRDGNRRARLIYPPFAPPVCLVSETPDPSRPHPRLPPGPVPLELHPPPRVRVHPPGPSVLREPGPAVQLQRAPRGGDHRGAVPVRRDAHRELVRVDLGQGRAEARDRHGLGVGDAHGPALPAHPGH